MTQSLIAFAVLQLASLAIICAFGALERLRWGPRHVRGKLHVKPITRTTEAARKRAPMPKVGRRGSVCPQQPRANLPGWRKPRTVASTLRREHEDA
jgi:hypothetical protein